MEPINATSITKLRNNGVNEGLLKGVLYGFMAIAVFFINFMVVVSYRLKKQKRGILDIFMLSFAFSSIFTSFFVICIVAYVRATHSEQFIGKTAECYVQYLFGTMLRLTDVATTTVIAVDRYISVSKPIFYRTNVHIKQGYIACGVIWGSSAFIAIIPFMTGQNISREMESLCTADWTTAIAVVVLSISYIQFIVVLVCYIGIFKSIKAFVKRHKEISRRQSDATSTINIKTAKKKMRHSISLSSFSSTESTPSCSDSVLSHSNQSYEVEMADRLVQLSRDNINAALRRVSGAESIKFESNLRFTTTKTKSVEKGKEKKKTHSSIDLRVKAAVNRVSWSDSPKETIKTNSASFDKVENRIVKAVLCRSKTVPVSTVQFQDNNDVFIEEKPKPVKHSQTLDNRKPTVRKNVSVVIKNKLKTTKLRRTGSSSIRHFWKESQHFAKIMGVIVFLFYLSWLPLAVAINVVLASGNQAKYHNTLWTCYNLSLISSVAIPIVYAVMCKPYREAYKRLWNCIKFVGQCRVIYGGNKRPENDAQQPSVKQTAH